MRQILSPDQVTLSCGVYCVDRRIVPILGTETLMALGAQRVLIS